MCTWTVPSDETTSFGTWWLASDPSTSVAGVLKGDEVDGWTLETIGRLAEVEPSSDGLSLVPLVTVFGRSAGRQMTIHNVYLEQVSFPSLNQGKSFRQPDQYRQRWRGQRVVTGCHLHPIDRLSWASFRVAGFREWWPTRVGRHRMRVDEDGQLVDTGGGPVLTEFSASGDWTVELSYRAVSSLGVWSASTVGETTLSFTRPAGFDLDELQDQVIGPVVSLVKLVLGFDSGVDSVSVGSDLDSTGSTISDGYSVQSIGDHRGVGRRMESDFSHLDALFTSEDVDGPRFVSRWLELAGELRLPFALLRGEADKTPVQLRANEAVAALETLDRRLSGQEVAPLESKVARIKAAVDGHLTSSDRRWLWGQLDRSLEPSLEERLVTAVRSLGDEFSDWMFAGHVREWAKVSARVRNVLSHGLIDRAEVIDDVGALIAVATTASLLVELRLLVEAGLPSGLRLVELISGKIAGAEQGLGGNRNRYQSLSSQSLADWSELARKC